MKRISSILFGFMLLAAAAPALAAPDAAGPIYTNKVRFRIPYRFDAEEMARLSAREIRLFVSVDRGQRWQHIQSVPPQQGKFEFKAPRDGEYWFAVRTVDGRNQLHPEGEISDPGLKVVVDTALPVLQLRVTPGGPGRVQLQWSTADPAIDVNTLKLEYVEPGGTDWRTVAIVPKAAGQTSWTIPRGGLVAVRGTVSDRAGNEARAQDQTRIAAADAAAPRPSVPDFRQPIAGLDAGQLQVQPQPPAIDQPLVTAPTFPSMVRTQPLPTPIPYENDLTGGNQPFGTVGDEPSRRPEVFQGRFPAVSEPAPAPATPSGRVRIVNSRKFKIDYELDDVGPSGISMVELFITQDGGRKWYRYGADADNRSPFEVEVPGPGTFGFDIRASSGVGLVNDPPQSGEDAPIVVVVDQTPPVVSLYPVEQGTGADTNKLSIRWQVQDENPSSMPVALYYSASPNGPWEPISGWEADRGQYEWTVGPSVPTRLYVRLSARDAAGNVTHAQTREPVVIDLSRPKARIVDIEAMGSRQFPQ